MSYDLGFCLEPFPDDDKEGWASFNRFMDVEDYGDPHPRFAELVGNLTEQFPEYDGDGENPDDSIWAGGPLIGNAGRDVTYLGIRPSKAAYAVPRITKIACDMGIVVLDPQDETIIRPGDPMPELPEFDPDSVPGTSVGLFRLLFITAIALVGDVVILLRVPRFTDPEIVRESISVFGITGLPLVVLFHAGAILMTAVAVQHWYVLVASRSRREYR